jgi:hypothetical protein
LPRAEGGGAHRVIGEVARRGGGRGGGGGGGHVGRQRDAARGEAARGEEQQLIEPLAVLHLP